MIVEYRIKRSFGCVERAEVVASGFELEYLDGAGATRRGRCRTLLECPVRAGMACAIVPFGEGAAPFPRFPLGRRPRGVYALASTHDPDLGRAPFRPASGQSAAPQAVTH